MYKLILCFALTTFSFLTHALVEYQSSDPQTAAQIDQFKIPVASFDLIFQIAFKHDQSTSKAALIRSLIENHLFSREAEREFGIDILNQKNSVGFDAQVDFDRDFVKTFFQRYREAIQASIKQLPGSTLSSLLKKPIKLEHRNFQEAVELKNALEYNLSEDKAALAKKIILATYQLPNSKESKAVSLWDIYKRQNLQGRVAIHQKNMKFLEGQLRDYLLERYVHYWARNESGLSNNDVDALTVLFKDRLIKEKYLSLKGLNLDLHHNNQQQTEKAKQVTKKEILAYYKKHKDEFQIVEKVHASHIRLGSQAVADKVYKEVDAGLPFKQAVKLYSISADKSQANAGDLGWIKSKDKHSSWLKGVAFIQSENKISKPFRSPQKAGQDVFWEIILVHTKVVGYQAPDSEGVRYEASRNIAKKKLAQEFKLKRKQLLESSNIFLNKKLLGANVY